MTERIAIKQVDDPSIVQAIRSKAVPLTQPKDLTPLIDQISRAKIVMLGESSHGTHEFYEWRRIISEWLITKHDFNFIAVEGDWPACWALNHFIQKTEEKKIEEVLQSFNRWPTWMWANSDMVRFVHWLKTHNQISSEHKRVGFYGLDIYSLFESVDAVLMQLEQTNPFLARRTRSRYSCFKPFDRNEKAYVKSLFQNPEGCESQVLETFQDILRLRPEGIREKDAILMNIQQNARIVASAENYYRSMSHGNDDSWNVRDRHMMETLEFLLERLGSDSKAIVWAHNTHIGDYRATPMAREGHINIGGLAREMWGEDQVALVGFGTYEGKVIASHAWDGPIQTLDIPQARSGSYEALFHEVARSIEQRAFFLPQLSGPLTRISELSAIRGHRAIGVVYQPAYERLKNYVPTALAQRYDAFVYIDKTTALEPLTQEFKREEIPETWPQGQ